MASNLTNNQVLLKEIVKQEFDDSEQYSDIGSFFEFFSFSQILKEYDLSDEEIESGRTGSGCDGGCDGIYIFLDGQMIDEDFDVSSYSKNKSKMEMYILQGKHGASFGEDVILKWKDITNNLLKFDNDFSDFKSRYNEDVLTIFNIFRSTYIKLARKGLKLDIKYIYATQGDEVHPNVQQQADELQSIARGLFPSTNVNISVDFFGADKLMNQLNIIANNEYSILLKETPVSMDGRKDYVALVELRSYFKFVTNDKGELIRHIFESNVRDYQGSTSVNSEIQASLKNMDTTDFWWLNNGITILATEAMPITSKEIMLTAPEIVNGLQTTTEIFNYFKDLPERVEDDQRCLLVRIIVPDDDTSRDRIIFATNSQTNIPKSSLRVTDAIHRQIERYFSARDIYYDRRKNFYKNQGKKRADIISVSFLAQCLISILLQLPDYARARPSTLLTDDDNYKTMYDLEADLETYYKAAIIGNKIRLYLNTNTEYSKVVKGDILFYVIFYAVAKKIGKSKITHNKRR